MVWIPDEKILFGGNGVRNYNGWVGNIADADIKAWPETVKKMKNEFGDAKIIIPGHGSYGGPELLDYTINMYSPDKWSFILWKHWVSDKNIFHIHGKILDLAEWDTLDSGAYQMHNALICIERGKGYYTVESPYVTHDVKNKTIRADHGILTWYKKKSKKSKPVEKYYFNRLNISLREDEVDMVVIMKDFIR